MILAKKSKKHKKTRFLGPKLGGGKLVRFLDFENFGSKLGGEGSWFVYVDSPKRSLCFKKAITLLSDRP